MQQWARVRLRRSRPGSTSAARPTACSRRPEWRKKTFESDWDRAWNPGDSIQLAIGQKDLLVTPLQMAAFYAMLANGGNVVTPYLVSDVEQPRREGVAASGPAPVRAAAAAARGRRPGALAAVRDGLYLATHSASGTSSGVFANYRCPISGKTGTAEKVVPLPGYPADHLEDQSWWCGWGPSDSAKLVVCALIENGGHGSTAAAPAALRVFERSSASRRRRASSWSTGLMIEVAAAPAHPAVRPSRAGARRVPPASRLDPAAGGSSRSSATGSGSSRASRASTSPATRATSSSARESPPRSASSA